MIRTMMLIPMVAVLLACGILTPADDPETEVIDLSAMHAEGPAAQIEDPLPTTEESERTVEVHGDLALPLYAGDSLIEEKIIESSVIAKAMMTSFSSEVIVEADGKYAVVLKFNLAVSEYLKGTATSSIVAVWVDGSSYDTNAEANDAKAIILAERDDQWDDREAIIFLYGVGSGLGASLDAQLQLADHFLLYVGDPYSPDDFYSLHSKRHKAWLPAASSTGSIGDSQEFLLDVPPPTRTITLGDLKGRITEVTAELNGGDGSEEYRECALNKYRYIRNQRNWPEERGYTYGAWDLDYSLVSGHPAGTVLDRQEVYTGYPAGTEMLPWLEGSGASLFDVAAGDSTASDTDGDGEYDTTRYDEIVKLARPIPAGEYRFDLKESWPSYAICDFVISNEWTVTAVAPDGVLHEAFFDPVTDGNAVAADSTNGVLKPATFTDANGASSTIERIAWETLSTGSGQAGTVKLRVSPHTSVAGHVMDFIELDGTVSLSLNADDATADAANDTLSWAVASQPWEDGDQLMVRIREVRGACSNGAVVPNPGESPGLVSDCMTLLTAREVLRGTASLNWSATTAIASWNGITLTGTPGRVTRLDLSARGLTGTIPRALAGLSALVTFDLSDNDLTGEIPEDLAGLRSLETLRLSGNSLTGCIPMALMSVATNDLGSLGLPGCVEGGPVPAPEGVSVTLSAGTFRIAWRTVTGAAQYEGQQRIGTTSDNWVSVGTTTAATLTYSPAEGPACGTTYHFRVRAYGNGIMHIADWGEPSEPEPYTTDACNRAPEFATSTYSFTVAEDAATMDPVGTVLATDPDDDPVSYAITGGNAAGTFKMSTSTGAITAAGALDHETVPSYTLTVEASDGRGGMATTTVAITVTDVAEDLASAPQRPGVTLTGDTFGITWSAVDGASDYEVQQRVSGSGDDWALVATTAGLSATYSPSGGAECGTTYEFRVRAYGDGTTYVADWGSPSEPGQYTTDACNRAPEFATSTYSFMVAEDATTTDPVGTVLATDPDADPVSYAITGGNAAGTFDMSTSTGAITVAGALDHEAVPSYTLTVEASDGRGGSDTTTVEVTVTDVAEDPPPAPQGLGVTLTDDTFGITWSVVDGAGLYEVQQRVSGSGDDWALVATTAGLSATYSPSGGAACGTTYEFRVLAYGDGTTYVADLGAPSEPEPYTTAACNRPPQFRSSSYTLTILENAATSTSVGTISATDPDGDTVSYSITAGNEDGKFAIATSTGAITLTESVDPDVVAFYALTVEAGDGVAGTSAASVGVALLLDECSNGTVVSRPRSNPRLVRDCSMLLAARDTLAGDASLDWSADTDINDWQGLKVERGESPYVRVLLLTGMGLTGRIPPALGGVADLRRIDLDDNMLTGGIPRELGSLSDLVLMYMHTNRMTGGIPPELGALSNLQSLFLSDNMLTGGIPAELGRLRNLRELTIEDNSLTGSIPPELGNLTRLEALYLSENTLTGGIPAELGKLRNLKYLLLERNSLGGEIPSQLGDLTRLVAVYLRNNGLTGAIPPEWGDLPNLAHLYLSSGNGFTGCIPSGLRDVADNDLAGLGLNYCS